MKRVGDLLALVTVDMLVQFQTFNTVLLQKLNQHDRILGRIREDELLRASRVALQNGKQQLLAREIGIIALLRLHELLQIVVLNLEPRRRAMEILHHNIETAFITLWHRKHSASQANVLRSLRTAPLETCSQCIVVRISAHSLEL